MKMLTRAAIWLSTLLACTTPAAAQRIPGYNARSNGVGPAAPCSFNGADGTLVACAPDTPLPSERMTTAATSTPFTTAITAAGSYGPFVPQLGRTIWVTLTGTWSGAVQVGTTTTGNCADAVPLTVGGQSWANFTANANEPVGEETRAGAGWCLIVDAGFTGTLNPRLGQ